MLDKIRYITLNLFIVQHMSNISTTKISNNFFEERGLPWPNDFTVCPRSSDPSYIGSNLLYKMGLDFFDRP